MDQIRLAEAIEAAAQALHDSLRDPDSYRWEAMTEGWRQEMRVYVRPAVIAALAASDAALARLNNSKRPRIPRTHLNLVGR